MLRVRFNTRETQLLPSVLNHVNKIRNMRDAYLSVSLDSSPLN